MAIQIPQGYAQGYGQAAQAQTDRRLASAQGLASLFKTSEQKYHSDLAEEISFATEPLMTAFAKPVENWSTVALVDFTKIKNSDDHNIYHWRNLCYQYSIENIYKVYSSRKSYLF